MTAPSGSDFNKGNCDLQKLFKEASYHSLDENAKLLLFQVPHAYIRGIPIRIKGLSKHCGGHFSPLYCPIRVQ